MINKDSIVYVDLDGVLVDLNKGFSELTGSFVEEFIQKNGDAAFWDLLEKQGDKWWTTLPFTQDGKELWTFVRNNFKNVKILSSSGSFDTLSNRYARLGKYEWVLANLFDIYKEDIIIVNGSSKKAVYARPGDILIDDLLKNIQRWNKNKGIGLWHHRTVDTIKALQSYIDIYNAQQTPIKEVGGERITGTTTRV